MISPTRVLLVLPLLACTLDDVHEPGFRQAVGVVPGLEETSTAPAWPNDDVGVGIDADPCASGDCTAELDMGTAKRSFQDSEAPRDVFKRGCVQEYSDDACGTKAKLHYDRCYAQDDDHSPIEMYEVFAYEGETACERDTCCPQAGEEVVNCWQKCQVPSGEPKTGHCVTMEICVGVQTFGCDKVPCFGQNPGNAARCECKASSAARDSDGFDPGTRGCLTKYAEAECGGAKTYEPDTCEGGGLFEVGSKSNDLGWDQAAGTCGTAARTVVLCSEWCKSQNHKKGSCVEASIDCGGQMVDAGKCVCTD